MNFVARLLVGLSIFSLLSVVPISASRLVEGHWPNDLKEWLGFLLFGTLLTLVFVMLALVVGTTAYELGRFILGSKQ